MKDKINKALKTLEAKEDCKILFAAESGSRAWGFASPDSDYDIRIVYVKPERWYWDIAEKKPDTFEAMLPNNLDISAWELRKSLQHFAKCNPSFNEWINSPIIYFADETFLKEIKNLLSVFFNPIRAAYHYLYLSENSWRTMNEQKITYKKLFYALRGLFCALWSIQKKTMPPTEFDALLREDLIPNKILNLIPELKVQKEAVNEKTKLTLPQNLYDFYLTEKTLIKQQIETLHFERPVLDPLNNLLQQCVQKYSITK